ncbi:SH3 domain-containing protein [Rouxiella sp. WC2420]|uniref:SH3 domain-containing protein n=1 Tax=Rouxiella sp. WC2420 TaxID=3234145 RepID=A0AB39VXL3_9GAMM
MKKIITLACLFALAGCQAPKPSAATDDTLVSSTVDGVSLTYRHVVQPPKNFTPLNLNYRALYTASVMSNASYGGKLIKYVKNGEQFEVLGIAESNWLAISDRPDHQLIGYMPLQAAVKSDLYEGVIAQPRRRSGATQCVKVDGGTQACRQGSSATWVIK